MLRPGEYNTMRRSQDYPFHLRKAMIRHARQHGLRDAARAFGVTRNTVRTWARRYDRHGQQGLASRSTRPKTSPNKISVKVEKQIIEAKTRSGFGAQRLIEEFELPCGLSAVRRVFREHRLTQPRRKKHHKKNDLRAVKQRYQPLQRLQMDSKYLDDLPHYWEQAKRLGLPWFQYTVRDVRSGAMWITFSQQLGSVYAELTVRRLLGSFQRLGLDISQTVVKSDNGSEFKGQQLRDDPTYFPNIIAACGATHRYNPPQCPNANADVESSHGRIEPEFYDRENFRDREDFFNKVFTYQTYWQLGRPNRSKNKQTPLEILKQCDPGFPVEALLIPPVLVDNLLAARIDPGGVGHKVSPPPERACICARRRATAPAWMICCESIRTWFTSEMSGRGSIWMRTAKSGSPLTACAAPATWRCGRRAPMEWTAVCTFTSTSMFRRPPRRRCGILAKR